MKPQHRARKRAARRAFWGAWIRSPRTVGAIAPSGPFLSRAMARQVDAHHAGTVVEIGAGGGAVTRALLEAGVKPERLLVIERDRRLCALLKRHFPQASIVHGDAAELASLLAEHRVHKVSAIVSSLPLLALPKPVCEAIVKAMLHALEPGAPLIQFTYSIHSPISRRLLKRHRAEGRRARWVALNFPPAMVWRYERV